jgi:RecA-family ATPase
MKSGDSILNPIDASRHAAQLIASRVPDALFCGFSVTTKDGKTRKQPLSLNGPGVGVDTPEDHLIKAANLPDSVLPMGATYWGVVMQKRPYIQNILGDDYALVILDLDTKNSTAPRDIRIEKLLNLAREQNLLTERSHSLKGGHIIFLAPANENLPKKIKLGNSQEIEIFGLNNSAGKSVMLTGDKLRGDILPIDSLIDLLHQAGITDEVIFPPLPEQPTEPIFPTQSAQPAPIEFTHRPLDEMDKAEQALTYISIAKGDYETWIEMGMALQKGFGEAGFPLWVHWSSNQPEFKGEEDCRAHWKSFKPNGRTSLGTLFHLAKQGGYTPPTPKTERKSAIEDFNIQVQAAQPQTTNQDGGTNQDNQPYWNEVDLDLNHLKPIDYLIDGFLAHSLMILAGQPGAGKTTAMLSLAMVVAGFHLKDCSLSTEAPRKIIYVTEDVSQIQLSLFSYAKHHGINPERIKEMIHVIEARRSEMPDILQLTTNITKHTITQGTTILRPWLILDTASATFDIEDENNNSEVAVYMEGIKQTIYTKLNTPVAIATHTAKSNAISDDSATARGASAWTGNATLTATLFIGDDENRYLSLVKKRYQPPITELKFQTFINNEVTVSRWGNIQDVVCITVIPTESSKEIRQQTQEQAKDERISQKALDKADEACAYVQSIINDHPEGVIIRRGSNAQRSVPSDLQGCYQLHWDDIYNHVPGTNKGQIRRTVGASIFQRFAPSSEASGWIKLC